MNEGKLLHFPITQEMRNRLNTSDSDTVLINYYQEKIIGPFSSYPLTPLLAYGEVPILDHSRNYLIFDDHFGSKIRKIGLYRMTKRLYKEMEKSLAKLKINNSFTKEGFEFHALFDRAGFDYFIEEDEWFCLASVTLPEDLLDDSDQITFSKDKFKKLYSEIKLFQKEINKIMNKFKIDVEELVEAKKKNSKNKNIKDIVLNIDVA